MAHGTTVLLLAMLALPGCNGGRTVVVTQYPRWEFQRYPRIAVVDVRAADPEGRPIAESIRDQLTDLLAGNGAFTVLSRADLKDVVAEQDLSRLAEAADPETVIPEARIQAAQALVLGNLTTCELIAEQNEIRVPVYARTRDGRIVRDRAGRPVVVGEDVIPEYRHGAVLAGSVRVVDSATGKVLLSYTSPPIRDEERRRGRPPRESPQEIAGALTHQLATDLYKHIAPVQTKVKLKGSSLVVASDYLDGQYEVVKKLPMELSEFLVVVRELPPACDRNNFRVAITTLGGREPLWEQEFVWQAGRRQAMHFAVPTSLLVDSGQIEFVAKLYSGDDPQPLLRREFRLDVPKEQREKREQARTAPRRGLSG